MASGLRSRLTNYGDPEFALFLRKAFIKGAGYSDEALDKPIIGIANTYSGFNPCHGNVPQLVEAVKRGVLAAGGLPIEFPTISLHESFASPTSMYLRNLMSIDTEEMLKAQPIDAAVLIGGCDKTIPAQLMGALSANVPSISLASGSMLTGAFKGQRVGACTDCRSYWAKFRAGEIDIEDITAVNSELVGSVGTCSVMGTASTMACVTEGLGMMVYGGATPPAVTANRVRVAERTGVLATGMAGKEEFKPSRVLNKDSFENAIRVLLAIGGSTNGIVHLTAIARRLGIQLTLSDLDRLGQTTPVLVDLKPSGASYMEDFDHAGGMPQLFHRLSHLLHLSARTVSGMTLGEEIANGPKPFALSERIIRPLSNPIYPNGGLVPLYGNLAPNGALIKVAAANPRFLEYRGKAVVFASTADMAARIDDPKLAVTPESVLVLQNIGPVSAGFPEAGLIPIPRKLASRGVRDMLRISDGRMSGTAGGSIVLHVSPEAGIGGAIGLVRDGDELEISVNERRLSLCVDNEELERRRKEMSTRLPIRGGRGYEGLYKQRVLQAEDGADFDFLGRDDCL